MGRERCEPASAVERAEISRKMAECAWALEILRTGGTSLAERRQAMQKLREGYRTSW
jgi:hypothetical protein